jgi:hypothetical protein
VEDLFARKNNMLLYLVKKLLDERLFNLAKGVYLRNNLRDDPLEHEILRFNMEGIAYDYEKDPLPSTDKFSPVTLNALSLPSHVKIYFVAEEHEIDFMREECLGQDLLSFDMAWRPSLSKTEKRRLSVMTLATRDAVFMIDMIKLADNLELDQTMKELISQTTLLVYALEVDELTEYMPYMTFYQNIPRFIDLKTPFTKLFDMEGEFYSGLSCAVKQIFGERLCKRERVSNWERRPLRLT